MARSPSPRSKPLARPKPSPPALPGSKLVVGLVGQTVQPAADRIATCGASAFLGVAGADFAPSRYATDAAAAEALAKAAQATVILAPATSRWNRVLPGVAQRLGGRADTHVTGLSASNGKLSINRWYYRQRMEAVLQRTQRPWFILVDPGSQPAWQGERRDRHRPSRPRDSAGDLQAHHRGRRARTRCRRANHPPRGRACCWSPAPAGPRSRPTASRT